MATLKPIEIGKPGKAVASNGVEFDFTPEILAELADSYDPAVFEAPLVVGHPAANDPAYGWAESVRWVPGSQRLLATPKDVEASFAEAVNAARFKRVSMSIYLPGSPSNPHPGKHALRHIGFLGAQAPAIKGLKPVSFADAEDGVLSFEAPEQQEPTKEAVNMPPTPEELAALEASLKAREQALNDKERQLQREDAASFAEGLVKAGQLAPADKPGLVELLAGLGDQALEFGEGGDKASKPCKTWLKGFLSKLPKIVDFAEFDGGKTQGKPAKGDDKAIARKARQYHADQHEAGNYISFAEAVDHVTEQQA